MKVHLIAESAGDRLTPLEWALRRHWYAANDNRFDWGEQSRIDRMVRALATMATPRSDE